MVNILVKDLVKQFESKEVNLAQVNTDDGRTFSVSISMKISENSSKNGKSELTKKPCNRSMVECDTSGCMNSSPDSDRSGILNSSEFVDHGTCNVDDFLNDLDDPTFQVESQSTVATVNAGMVDGEECESDADSDCNSVDVEYFVVDELVGKRFNDKTQKYEFLLRPKRYIPKNEIIWNPIDNQDNFDVSLLEHGRLYIEVPDFLKLKKNETRKRSILQDKFLSEVNIPSERKVDYSSSAMVEPKNSSACRKLDTSSMGIDNTLNKFDEIYVGNICSGSNDATMDMDVEVGTIQTNFEELVPVVLIDTINVSQASDAATFQNCEQKSAINMKPKRSYSAKKVYKCADCDYYVTTKACLVKHVRQHVTVKKVRRNNRKRIRDSSPVSKLGKVIKSHPKNHCDDEMKRLNGAADMKKDRLTKSELTKRRKCSYDEKVHVTSVPEKGRIVKDFVEDGHVAVRNVTRNRRNLKNNENEKVTKVRVSHDAHNDNEELHENHLNQLNDHSSDGKSNTLKIKFKSGVFRQNGTKKIKKNVARIKGPENFHSTPVIFTKEDSGENVDTNIGNVAAEKDTIFTKKKDQLSCLLNGALIEESQKRCSSVIQNDEDQNIRDDHAIKKRRNLSHEPSSRTELRNEVPREIPPSENNQEQANCKTTLRQSCSTEDTSYEGLGSGVVQTDGGNFNYVSVPVTIPLAVLEKLNIDIEMLRRISQEKKASSSRLLHVEQKEVIEETSEYLCCTTTSIVDVLETLPNESIVIPLPEHTSSFAYAQVSENESTLLLNDATMVEEIISKAIDDMIVVLETHEKRSAETNPSDFTETVKSYSTIVTESQSAELLPNCNSDPEVAKLSMKRENRNEQSANAIRELSVNEEESQEVEAADRVICASKSMRRLLPCQFCSFTTPDMRIYKDHVRVQHSDKFIPCWFYPLCTKRFTSKDSRSRHELEKHANYFPNVCLRRLDLSNLPFSLSTVQNP